MEQLVVVALVLVAGLLIGMISGIPVAFVLVISGTLALFIIEGYEGVRYITSMPWYKAFNYEILAIPLFIWMGLLLRHSGMINQMFRMITNWVGRVPGSLVTAILITSGAFAAMSGSGAASTATMGATSYPEALKYGYDRRFVAGAINAGGGLAPLIPPSVALVFYSSLTDVSVARLFAGGIIPGVVALAMLVGYVIVRAVLNPSMCPKPAPVGWSERIASLSVLPSAAVTMFFVLGGIFLGWYTPTEAAAIGVVTVILTLTIYRRFNFKMIFWAIWNSLREATAISVIILVLVVCGYIYSQVLTYFGLPQMVGRELGKAGLSVWQLQIAMVVLTFVLGMFLDSWTLMVITIPFLVPILLTVGVDLVWFGIFIVAMMEIGTMTPPFGMHFFVLQGVTGISYEDAVRGVFPFVLVWLVFVAVIILFPELVTWLPEAIF